MARTNVFHLFLGYVALILFGSIWLSLKYLSDLADCQENSKKEQSSFPHESDIVHNDPWNVNDHHVTYGHRELYEKKRRGIVKPNTEPPLQRQKGKYVRSFKQLNSLHHERSLFKRSNLIYKWPKSLAVKF